MSANQKQIDDMVACLEQGGVVMAPTDTVYGLAASAKHPAAVDRIYELKQRPRHMNLPIMVASLDDLLPLGVEINDTARQLAASPFVPGAITLVVGFKDKPLVPWLDGRDEIAFRIPQHDLFLAALRRTGPLLVTSANKSGIDVATAPDNILPQLHGTPDLVIDGGAIDVIPSTLINCRTDPPQALRIGAVAVDQLKPYISIY